MRGLALVLTLAFVFAAGPLLMSQVVGQSSPAGVIEGTVCQAQAAGNYSPQGYGAGECQYQQALQGASLYLTRPGAVAGLGASNRSATSDDRGFYSFLGVDDGDYTLTAVHAGFESQSRSVHVAADKQVQDFPLQPEAVTISGAVTRSDDGSAVAGAQLDLCCTSGSQVSATSGRDGSFSVKAPAGWQSIHASRAGFQDFNDYRFVDGSEPLAIALQPIPPQDAAIHGKVLDQHGHPVSGAVVAVTSYSYGGCCYASSGTTTSYAPPPDYADGGGASSASGSATASPMRPCCYNGGQNSTTTDAAGRYSIHVYGGGNSLSVSKDGYAPVSLQVEVASGEDHAQDITLNKYPDKTAHLVGRVTDGKTGKGLGLVTISVQSPAFGITECSVDYQDAATTSDQPASDKSGAMYPYPGPAYNGCIVKVDSDGTYHADVTPGYAIVQVDYEQWKSCRDSTDADGSSSHTCGPEYDTWSRSLLLPENATTRVDVPLHQKPAPDAVVSGYLVDATTGKAIPGAQVSFQNLDAQGYGYATTDGDGSYKLRLRSGYHMVYVSAPNHLHWQGVLEVKPGETPFDVPLQPGQESYGGCYGPCMYADKGAPMPASAAGSGTYAMTSTSAPQAGNGRNGASSGGSGAQYEDLGGGLGPYDAAARSHALATGTGAPGPSHGSPPIGGLLAMAAVVGLVAVRRRLAP